MYIYIYIYIIDIDIDICTDVLFTENIFFFVYRKTSPTYAISVKIYYCSITQAFFCILKAYDFKLSYNYDPKQPSEVF